MGRDDHRSRSCDCCHSTIVYSYNSKLLIVWHFSDYQYTERRVTVTSVDRKHGLRITDYGLDVMWHLYCLGGYKKRNKKWRNRNRKQGNTGSPHSDWTLKMIRILPRCTRFLATFMEGLRCALVPITLNCNNPLKLFEWHLLCAYHMILTKVIVHLIRDPQSEFSIYPGDLKLSMREGELDELENRSSCCSRFFSPNCACSIISIENLRDSPTPLRALLWHLVVLKIARKETSQEPITQERNIITDLTGIFLK